MGYGDNQQESTEQRENLPAGLSDGDLLFWREELPALGGEYSLRVLFEQVTPCPICGGSGTYRSARTPGEIPCFCRVQQRYQQEAARWRALSQIPLRYQHIDRSEIVQIERSLTPIQRAQFAIAFKAIERFIQSPAGNLILIGAVSTGRSMLAAYIARQLEPIPAVFLSLRQLIDLLTTPESEDTERIHDLLYTAPVLIVDDFTATYTELDDRTAGALYDLIYYRWSQALPNVITSAVGLDRLEPLYGSLLDYLQQDAEVYTLEWGPVQVPREPTTGPAGKVARPVPVQVYYCPWLAAEDGSDTPSIFPTPHNVCRRATVPQPVALAHQAAACLAAEHKTCPVFQTPADQPVESLPEGILLQERRHTRRQRSRRVRLFNLLATIGIVSGLILWGILLFNRPVASFVQQIVSGPTPAVTPTLRPTLTPSPTATSVPPTLTPTPVPPTATLPPAPSVTPVYAAAASLAFDTNLREAPGLEAPIITMLPAGTALNILGRDGPGRWLRVDTAEGLSGWLLATQIAEPVDILALPIYMEAPTPMPQAQADNETAQLLPDRTPTPGIPATFNMMVYATDIGTCGYPDITAEYTFRLRGESITLIRHIDSTVLIGSYNPASGSFQVSATHDIAIETLSGSLRLEGGLIRLSGEQQTTFFDGTCGGLWSVSGQTYTGGQLERVPDAHGTSPRTANSSRMPGRSLMTSPSYSTHA